MQHVTECHVDPVRGPSSLEERDAAEIQYLALAGLGCPNCAMRVRNALLLTHGVVDAEIDLGSALARVWFRDGEVGVVDMVHAVALAGRGTHHRYLAVPVEDRA